MSVLGFQAGFAGYAAADWKAGWSIFFETDLAGYTIDEDFSDNLVDAGDTKRVEGVDGAEVITQEERAKEDLAQEVGYDSFQAMTQKEPIVDVEGKLRAEIIRSDFLNSIAGAKLANFIIQVDALTAFDESTQKMLLRLFYDRTENQAGLFLGSADGDDIFRIGADYDFQDQADEPLDRAFNFSPDLVSKTISVSVSGNDSGTDSHSNAGTVANYTPEAGRNAMLMIPYSINLYEFAADDGHATAEASLVVKLEFLDDTGTVFSATSETRTGKGNSQIIMTAAIPDGTADMRVVVDATVLASCSDDDPSQFPNSEARATVDIQMPDSPLVIVGNQNGMSALGASWVAGRKRVRIDAEKGETSATQVKIENPDNYNQYVTQVVEDNGGNGRLSFKRPDGSEIIGYNI